MPPYADAAPKSSKYKMKILVISARYPPCHLGGYEIRCKEIIDGLSRRGHQVLVLTSRKEVEPRSPDTEEDYKVLRLFSIRSRRASVIDALSRKPATHGIGMFLTFFREVLLDIFELGSLDRWIRDFQPEVIYLGHITALSRSFLPYLAGRGIPLVYDEGGSGLLDAWTEKDIWYKFVDRCQGKGHSISSALCSIILVIIPALSRNRLKAKWTWPESMEIIFNSALNRQNAAARGVPVENSRVIHSGVQLERFQYHPRTEIGTPVFILVPARLEPRKGQLDALQVLAELENRGIRATCLFIGEFWQGAYVMDLEQQIRHLGLGDRVTLRPMVEQDRLIALYHQAGICFFSSTHKTGFSRVPLEAMACGSLVISYGCEGSDEIIHNGETGYLLEPGDVRGVVQTIVRLLASPGLFAQVTAKARSQIEKNHSLSEYIDQVERVIDSAIHP